MADMSAKFRDLYVSLERFISWTFLFTAEYEWNSAESTGTASGYVTDLIAFLRSTFESFSHLPVSISIIILIV